MNTVSWFIIPAILFTLIFIFVPVFLWCVDRIFRKPLGSPLFHVQWQPWWIAATILLWILDRIWVHYHQL